MKSETPNLSARGSRKEMQGTPLFSCCASAVKSTIILAACHGLISDEGASWLIRVLHLEAV